MKINSKLIDILKQKNVNQDFVRKSVQLCKKDSLNSSKLIKVRPVSNALSITQSTNLPNEAENNKCDKNENFNFNQMDDLEKFDIIQEINDIFLQDELNEKNLSEITNKPIDQLPFETCLKFQSDLTLNSLQNLGEICPKLKQLKLNGSKISSIRDIGTSLQNLQILNVSRCQIQDVSGIQALMQLKELYASYNQIKDLLPIEYHQNISFIDLEGNEIQEICQIESLQTLFKLKDLILSQNPIEKTENYRQNVLKILNGLETLDETNTIDACQQNTVEDYILFKEEINDNDLITQSIKHSQINQYLYKKENDQSFMTQTFFQTQKTNQQNKRQNRYLDLIFQPQQQKDVISKINQSQAIYGNPLRGLLEIKRGELDFKKQDLQKPFDYLSYIMENKKLYEPQDLDTILNFSDEFEEKNLNQTMMTELGSEKKENKEYVSLNQLKMTSSRKFKLNFKQEKKEYLQPMVQIPIIQNDFQTKKRIFNVRLPSEQPIQNESKRKLEFVKQHDFSKPKQIEKVDLQTEENNIQEILQPNKFRYGTLNNPLKIINSNKLEENSLFKMPKILFKTKLKE